MSSYVTHLEAAIDGTILPADRPQTLHAGRPLWRYVCRPWGALDAGHALRPPADDVALSRAAAPAANRDARRRNVAAVAVSPAGPPTGRARPVGEGRIAASTGSFKSRGLAMAVTMCRQFGIDKVAIPPRATPAAPWHRPPARAERKLGVHARRHPFGQPVGSRPGRRANLPGERADQRLRGHRSGRDREGRLVRSFDAQGALPDRRQEDHGARTGRTVRLEPARRDRVPRRRRHRPDRHVEGV